MKIAGIDKAAAQEFMEMEVSDEAWAEFTSRRNGALLGVDLARDGEMRNRYVWQEGKEFALADFGGLTLYFAGTFTARDPTLRSVILAGDQFLQEVDDRRGVANQILVRIADRAEADRVATAIEALEFPVKLTAESQQFARDQAAKDLASMLGYASKVVAVLGLVILIGLANATSMAVRERVREIGLLRSLGFSRTRITALVSLESLVLALLGGVLGTAAAWAALHFGEIRVPAGEFSFPVTLGVPLALLAGVAATAVGLLGGLPAGVRASRRPIVDAIRSVD